MIEIAEPPKSTKFCPRKNGFYAHPDAAVCNIFYNCIDGDALEMKCTTGLHFDEYSGTCVWPDTAKREGCSNLESKFRFASAMILKSISIKFFSRFSLQLEKSESGFSCPKDQPKTDARGQVVTHPKYAHPTDCQKFYACLNGEDPRDLGCQLGEVFNEETEMCDAPENVPGCEDWYKDTDDKKQ